MKSVVHSWEIVLFVALFSVIGRAENNRLLALNFACEGPAAGRAQSIGDSLRACIRRQGREVVSMDLLEKLAAQKGLSVSNLGAKPEQLRSLLEPLGAQGVISGRVFSDQGLLTVQMNYLGVDSPAPTELDRVVTWNINDLYRVAPDIARIAMGAGQTGPHVVSVFPPDGQTGVGQYVEMRIAFSEAMNPAASSLAGAPQTLWQRYGETVYDTASHTFILKLRLYPGIDYEFHVNGEEAAGFKSQSGVPAPEYVWKFSTGW